VWTGERDQMNISPRVKTVFSFDLTLTEEEARALKELTAYGTDAFLNFFYKSLGKTYLQEHENGLCSLFKSIDTKLKPLIHKVDTVIKVSEETLKGESK